VEAILAYSHLLDADPTEGQAREAQYQLARSYLLDGEFAAAALAAEQFIARFPDDSRLPLATLMAARAYQAVGQCERAVPHYQAFQSHESVLDDRVYEWIGDCHLADVRFEDAVGAYRQAISFTSAAGAQAGLSEKVAEAYMALEDYEAAVAEYDDILDLIKDEDSRARMAYLAGQAQAAAGDAEAAFARYQQAVDRYPEAEHAYFALVELVYGGAEVDEFQRGLVDYYAGAKYPDAYGASIRAFDRYLASDSPDKAGEALYYRALAQRAVGGFGEALAGLDQVLSEPPDTLALDEVSLQKAATLAQAGESDAAEEAYRKLAASFPGSELAPEALWAAARLRQGDDAFPAAAKLYEELQGTFPSFEDADAALWYAGLARYRGGEVERAIKDWQTLLAVYPDSIYAPKTRYWLGKVGAAPGGEEAMGYWDQLQDELPDTYYALRVSQLNAGETLTATRMITLPVEPPAWDRTAFEARILSWLRDWSEVPTATQTLALPAAVTQAPSWSRGQILLEVGLRSGALDAFEQVVPPVEDDPLALAAFASASRERGLHGLALSSAVRLANLWPEGGLQEAPLTLRHLAYPVAYAERIMAEAQERRLDPLLLAALIRQESLFEPAAESWVGARGLGQVMPGTGRSIAADLGLEDFDVNDLYRPSVSIRFAAHYLASQLERFDEEILVALAAYNGGPGNALQWREAGGEDLDLFVEVITAVESRLYLQRILEQYVTYERLYRSSSE
jgi:soluble lytic murein transglycosylase